MDFWWLVCLTTLIGSLLLEQQFLEQKLTHKMMATSLLLVVDAQIIKSNTR